MRDGDASAALVDIDAALNSSGSLRLLVVKYQVLSEAGQFDAALTLLLAALPRAPGNGVLATLVAQAAKATGDYPLALEHARRARAAAPDSPAALAVLIEALLASGRADDASAVAVDFRTRAPDDQQAIALQATAWRVLGDGRYRGLYDYDAFVGVETLDTPPAWPNLDAYLRDLRDALSQAHHFKAHPFAQSVKRGTQAPSIDSWPHPATQALRIALDAPIQRYIAKLGAGATPAQSRNNGRYRFQGMWSIRMRAGGRHVNHVHPEGWLSSACYVETPGLSHGREGWLKFGEPDLAAPALPPEKFVEPIPGRLVLFPSYMWHGTLPFSGAGTRLTFAFDLVPG
jgi:tetratricopeptide (TPR) repeat protein